ncbi:TRL-like family protein [Leptospira congkakensis]|uniref:TRL-like family protein n=1 Tax=Leptospira congkakensis TaxID=2484932 RepID=A0A4Z1A6U3_9LEPT|nr:TRL-like family protein [Leptospira congkakensis]TGL86629.1 TRL-like family protein [Leptospira congkakensis]TGL93826.1 TRL-like family protein [Leptospira congkakensis]TGL94768.1 TRL-like family protein [Leptospira congkakensis]
MKKVLLLPLVFFLFHCLSVQIGNPSVTIFQNKGQEGWYSPGKLPLPNDRFVESCTTNYFGLVSVGNASLDYIPRNTRLKEIHSLDHYYKNQYFFFQELCLRITGR